MKKKNIVSIVSAVIFLSLTSCSDWLDVKPKTSVNEEDLFARELGFKEALTGVYVQMGSTSLYGREMTYGIVDALAQRYRVENTDYTSADLYTFPSTMTESYINSIWSNAYNIIANLNNYLSWIDVNQSVITTPGYYEIMKGEALGLRSFIYFDLLRLWGPVYKENATSPSIPYRTKFSREDKSLAPANVVLDSIIGNLKQAEQLLKDDPMHIEFPLSDSDEASGADNFLTYRFKRMNKYAVKALLARVYMYQGDKTEATKYASEVIDAVDPSHNSYFRLVTDNSKDRIFSTEIIFSLSLNKFGDRVTTDFNLLTDNKYHAMDKQFIYDMYDVEKDGYNDMRIREGQGFSFSAFGGYSRKYEQSNLYSFAITNTIPLIRLPEMYYIVAECSDYTQADKWLSMVRAARGADKLDPFTGELDKMNNVEKEYRKEFYAEGQLWYFYKRHDYKRFYGSPLPYDMTEKNYRFSIPDDEVVLGTVN